MTCRGRVSNGVVVLENAADLPNGTPVEVTPVVERGSNAAAIIAAMEAAPRLSKEDVDELLKAIAAAPPAGPPPYPVTEEQRRALLGLIGMWKMDNPPNDEDVERMIDEYRREKYG
jgi:hypothetical protein